MRSGLLVVLLSLASPPASAAGDLVAALSGTASRLLEALPEDARHKASFAFDDDEREDVRFAPLFLEGARYGELPAEAASLTDELLAVSLGPSGLAKVQQIRRNEQAVAAKDEGRWVPGFVVRRMRDPGRYFVAFFGEPSVASPWGYRYEGHHLSLNLGVVPGAIPATTPLFLGAEPRVAPGGVQVLGAEEAAARALLAALPTELRARATLPYVDDRDLMLGQVRRVTLGRAVGVARGEAPPAAQAGFDRLIELFAANFAAPVAAARIAEIDGAGRDALRFVWAEAAEPPGAFYWRLQGPRTLIEMDNTTDGDHVHAVWHDALGDFGDDLLGAHLRNEHGLALASAARSEAKPNGVTTASAALRDRGGGRGPGGSAAPGLRSQARGGRVVAAAQARSMCRAFLGWPSPDTGPAQPDRSRPPFHGGSASGAEPEPSGVTTASAARSEPEANGVTTASAARSEPEANGVTTASAARSEAKPNGVTTASAARSEAKPNGVTTAGSLR